MDGRTALIRGLEIAALGLLVLIVVGQLTGQPVLLSYVQTGSMEPTLEPGDGFVAIPAAVAGPVEPGDVIVFDADQLHDGGLVTHRVIGTTADGRYITKGDANPFTDQDGAEPPVQQAQIVAVALQIGGEVVVLPQLGAAVTAVGDALTGAQQSLARVFKTSAVLGTQGLAYLLFGLGLLAYGVSFLMESDGTARHSRQTDRSTDAVNAEVIILSMTVLLLAGTTAGMVLPGGAHSFEVISSQSNAPGPAVIQQGTTETLEFTVPSNGILPVVVFLEPGSDGVDVSPRELQVPSNGNRTATVALTAPPETGRTVMYLTEHRYLAVLPAATIRYLYGIHPWLPIVVIDILVGVGFAGLGTALLGTGRIRLRPSRQLSLRARVERWFR